MDPLVAFRTAVKGKQPISLLKDEEPTTSALLATHVKLSSSITLPKTTPTRIRKLTTAASSDPVTNPDDFLPLIAVYLVWSLKDASGPEYMKQVRESGLTAGSVSITERRGVVDWLEGKIADLPNSAPLAVESTTPPGSPTRAATSGSGSQTSAKRKYVPDAQDVEAVKKIRANEIELRDRNTILRGIKPNNFTSLQKAYQEKLKRLKEAAKTNPSLSKNPTIQQPPIDPKLQARKAKYNNPIIMISSSPTALITMYNVKKFFEDSTFEPSADAKQRWMEEGNGRPEDVIPIYRKKTYVGPGGKEIVSMVRYFVVDGTDALSKFGADAWDRVVCVMTTGQAWQFKPYKWSDPRQLFHHVKGIHLSWSNDPPNVKIQDWNVEDLKIDPHRRHVDKSVVAHFWKTLDSWTATNKPSLIS